MTNEFLYRSTFAYSYLRTSLYNAQMTGAEYRAIIRTIVRSALNKKAPGFNKVAKDELATLITVNIHARMYGANVDGVDSPLWRRFGEHCDPNVDASEILKQGITNEAK